MTNPVARLTTLRTISEAWRREVMTFCPGCQGAHPFTIELSPDYPNRGNGRAEPVWSWDGNLEAPTFSPSMLCYSTVHICKGEHPPEICKDHDNCDQRSHLILNEDWRENGAKEFGHNTPHTREPAWGNCHSFLREGQWQFLNDSAHSLAGKTVPMVPLPDWLMPKE